MALQLTIALPNGTSGSYIRLGYYQIDRVRREASAHFNLFTTEAQAVSAPSVPLVMIAKLRLAGDAFDTYLSAAVLDLEGVAVDAQLYLAAKVEPLMAGGGLTSVNLSAAEDV